MPSCLQNGCGTFSTADPTIFSRRSAGQTASEQPVWHIPMLPFRNTSHYSSSKMRVSGSQPLEDLSTPGQGQGEGPGDSKSERSEDDDGDGRGRSERSERSSSRGWAPRHDDSQRKKEEVPDRKHFLSGTSEERRRPTLPAGGPVPSARMSLTALFGMGRGGTSSL